MRFTDEKAKRINEKSVKTVYGEKRLEVRGDSLVLADRYGNWNYICPLEAIGSLGIALSLLLDAVEDEAGVEF